MTITEIQSDLDATVRDIGNLEDIIGGLESFIHDSAGEDRSAFRMDLFKYKALKDQAENLKARITQKMAEAVSDVILAPVNFEK